MKPTLSITSRQLMLREMHDYLMIALGMLFYAIGWTVFLLPNDITTGGVPGIASIVYWATGINVQYTYFAINGGLLIASLIVLGWKFSVKTIFAVIVMTTILPIIQSATSNLLCCKTNRLWLVSSVLLSAEAVLVSLFRPMAVREERISSLLL